MNRSVWQIAAATGGRSYAATFLKHGVALTGPGETGPWGEGRVEEREAGRLLRMFAEAVHDGDVFLLKTGLSRIRAVGIVAAGYEFLEPFDDVNGWDLRHARRVRWCELPGEYDFGGALLGSVPFCRARNRGVLEYVRTFLNSPPTHWQTAPLPALPAVEPEMEEAPAPIQGIVALVRDLFPVYQDRDRFGERPTERELVAHLVVPFLRALGWPPEQIAVEWGSIDVALFRALPRAAGTCHLVIEAKRLGAGVEGALAQGRRYVERLEMPLDVAVTDGVRYRLYSCAKGYAPVAYANLARLKRSAVELFEALKRP